MMTQKGVAAVITFSFLTKHLISKLAEWPPAKSISDIETYMEHENSLQIYMYA